MDDEELWTDDVLDALVDWCEEAYPKEGCGLILQTEDGGVRVHGTENLADKYHELDPEQYPRTAETFYVIDPREFMKAEERGETVEVVFHSHADVGDYFSDEDVSAATMPRSSEDEPWEQAHPGVDWLVVSVRDGVADHATLFRFEDGSADDPFVPVLEIDIEDGYRLEATDAVSRSR
jgi:adenylyltransferase/sulfurtransferase